jgi:hypothetical protein
MELNAPDTLAAQVRYARWLAWGTRIGLGLLVAAFLLYVFRLTSPHVPIEHLPELWKLPASHLLAETGVESGWGWSGMLPRGDMLVLAAIAILSSCSIACLAAVTPIFHARRERVFVAICILEIAVLVLAASGLLATH